MMHLLIYFIYLAKRVVRPVTKRSSRVNSPMVSFSNEHCCYSSWPINGTNGSNTFTHPQRDLNFTGALCDSRAFLPVGTGRESDLYMRLIGQIKHSVVQPFSLSTIMYTRCTFKVITAPEVNTTVIDLLGRNRWTAHKTILFICYRNVTRLGGSWHALI